MEFVDIDRNFIEVSKDTEGNLSIGRLWGRRMGGWFGWSDVLDRPRVVLFAEASSGKSAEFRNAAGC